MKYCKFDGFTYPDSVINCRACGGSLLDIPSNQDSPDQLASSVSASECPNPECEITFARTDQTRFCPGCGIHLEPTSVNLVDVYGTPQGVPERALSDTTQVAELIEKPKWRGRSRKNAGQAPERDIARVEESSANAVDKSTTVQSRPEVPACPHCGMMMRKPGDPFCGNCGRMFNGSGNSPGFSPTKGVNESPQPIESLTLPTQETHALPIKLILGV